jgi:hypothetical protein
MFRRWDRLDGDSEIPLAVVHEALWMVNLNPKLHVTMLSPHRLELVDNFRYTGRLHAGFHKRGILRGGTPDENKMSDGHRERLWLETRMV